MLADEKVIQIIFLAIGTNKAGNMCWLGFKNSQGLKSWSNGLYFHNEGGGDLSPKPPSAQNNNIPPRTARVTSDLCFSNFGNSWKLAEHPSV